MILSRKAQWAVGMGAAFALTLSACSNGADPATSGQPGGSGGDKVTISALVDNSEQSLNIANALANGFNASQDRVTLEIEGRPGCADGDNLIKTRLATGEANDIINYNSGSLFQAIDPAKNLVPLTQEPFMAGLDETFKAATSVNGEFFGVPMEQAMGGGILYNRKVYQDLGLEIPKTWAEFMANNAKIKAAGIAPVIQTYAETWTSQLLVLADFHNVTAAAPDWAEQYTAAKAKYVDEPAIKGFQRLQDVHDAGYLNEDFASASHSQGLQYLVDGKGAHYPMLTAVVSAYVALSPDAKDNIGFFAQPGDDAASYGITAWTPAAFYIPATTTGDKLAAAKEFFAYVASPAGCDAVVESTVPNGPFMVTACKLPDGLPQAVVDLQQFFTDGNNSLALEFVSPIKGPNLEKITVEVGSGIATAADGAARYDEDVKKQAQQLGLPGWD